MNLANMGHMMNEREKLRRQIAGRVLASLIATREEGTTTNDCIVRAVHWTNGLMRELDEVDESGTRRTI